MPDNPALRRLASLPSYHRLTPTQRTAVRLHVGKDIPGEEAMALAGDPNPARSWKSSRVQKCLADFRGAEPGVDELVAQFERADLEAARANWTVTPLPEKVALELPPIAPEPPPEPPAQPVDTPAPPTHSKRVLQREGPVVLGGDSGITLDGLFPQLDNLNLQFWRQQNEDEQQERKRLIAIIAQREERR